MVIPIAILVAGLGIAVAIYFVRAEPAFLSGGVDVSKTDPVNPNSDHIAGNPGAKIMLVEYSDIDCQYCKSFQRTLAQVAAEYGPRGDVAWVYRHFPLVDIHQHAASHAEASECVASIAGEPYFWRFIDAIHASSPDLTEFDPLGYEAIITSLGIDMSAFNACMAADTFTDKVSKDFEDALEIGANGTPFTVILVDGKEPLSISGAVSYASLKEIIDAALAQP